MESPSRYVSQNSNKKRVFLGGNLSSSSSVSKEVEVLEIPHPINHSGAKNNKYSSSNQKEVIPPHEIIIDIDTEEDDDDVVLIDGDVWTSAKGKDSLSSFLPVGPSSSSITNGASKKWLESGLDVQKDSTTSSLRRRQSFVSSQPSSSRGSVQKKSLYGEKSKKRSRASSSHVAATQSPMASATASAPKNVDEILQKFNAFKKFDTVEDYSDHYYYYSTMDGFPAKQALSKKCVKRIQEEWKILEEGLPDKIFVRVYESRMDFLRAVIVGADGTPYHDGLYFFDVYFPTTYPSVPPHVCYRSGGLDINPNLYPCGKVCLSLLNTWDGGRMERWIPGTSTMLQVLVSIQGLVLNAKPYTNVNGPGIDDLRDWTGGLEYNEFIFKKCLQTMLHNIRVPPKHFKDFVAGHFVKHGRDILVCCKAYINGAQLGCVAKGTGGVQDIDEGDKSSSRQFRRSVRCIMTDLVNAFLRIGAKDCEDFLSLTRRPTTVPASTVRRR